MAVVNVGGSFKIYEFIGFIFLFIFIADRWIISGKAAGCFMLLMVIFPLISIIFYYSFLDPEVITIVFPRQLI